VTSEGTELLECQRGWFCYIYYRRYTTAPIFYITPSVVYYESITSFRFNPKYIPALITDLGNEDIPIINAKIGLGRLIFDGFIDHTYTMSRWTE
jgi:hypothetical protein